MTHMNMARKTLLSVAAVAVTALLAGCGAVGMDPEAGKSPVPLPSPNGNRQAIAKENLVHLWPLTVDRGSIECRKDEQTVFVDESGKAYALNRKAEDAGVPKIDGIRRESEGGWQVGLGAMRSHALALCTTGKDKKKG
jgi:hypothetical protein